MLVLGEEQELVSLQVSSGGGTQRMKREILLPDSQRGGHKPSCVFYTYRTYLSDHAKEYTFLLVRFYLSWYTQGRNLNYWIPIGTGIIVRFLWTPKVSEFYFYYLPIQFLRYLLIFAIFIIYITSTSNSTSVSK